MPETNVPQEKAPVKIRFVPTPIIAKIKESHFNKVKCSLNTILPNATATIGNNK